VTTWFGEILVSFMIIARFNSHGEPMERIQDVAIVLSFICTYVAWLARRKGRCCDIDDLKSLLGNMCCRWAISSMPEPIQRDEIFPPFTSSKSSRPSAESRNHVNSIIRKHSSFVCIHLAFLMSILLVVCHSIDRHHIWPVSQAAQYVFFHDMMHLLSFGICGLVVAQLNIEDAIDQQYSKQAGATPRAPQQLVSQFVIASDSEPLTLDRENSVGPTEANRPIVPFTEDEEMDHIVTSELGRRNSRGHIEDTPIGGSDTVP